MKRSAIKRLCDSKSKVSSHYFIKNKWTNFKYGARFI